MVHFSNFGFYICEICMIGSFGIGKCPLSSNTIFEEELELGTILFQTYITFPNTFSLFKLLKP